MKMRMKLIMISVGLLLLSGLLLIGCSMFERDADIPTAPGVTDAPVTAADMANSYYSYGMGNGLIGALVKRGEFVLHLTKGKWRVAYTMPGGARYTRYLVFDRDMLAYFGTWNELVVDVDAEEGEFEADGAVTGVGFYTTGNFRGRGSILKLIVNSQVYTIGNNVFVIPDSIAYPPIPVIVTNRWVSPRWGYVYYPPYYHAGWGFTVFYDTVYYRYYDYDSYWYWGKEVILWEVGKGKGKLDTFTGGKDGDVYCDEKARSNGIYKTDHAMFLVDSANGKLKELKSQDNNPIPTDWWLKNKNGTFIASSLNSACGGSLTRSLSSAGVVYNEWWSGAKDQCEVETDKHCGDWKDDSNTKDAKYGNPLAVDKKWVTSASDMSCDKETVSYICASWTPEEKIMRTRDRIWAALYGWYWW
jgi:hypothetical protein